MQDKYVGDIGDFGKYSLLNAVSQGRKLGVAWYKYPDESNNDGKHIDYLDQGEKWRKFDPKVFDGLNRIVRSGRSIAAVESSDFFKHHNFSSRELGFDGAAKPHQNAGWRKAWFEKVCVDLESANMIFIDPDNGLRRKETFSPGRREHSKSVSLAEAKALSNGRPTIIYHHNSRFTGGNEKEIAFWLERLGHGTNAIRWRYISPRTYFLMNFDDDLREKARAWLRRGWDKDKVQFI